MEAFCLKTILTRMNARGGKSNLLWANDNIGGIG
jgi:hypothetical protein